ncbi:4253_t:CDS:1, partial [Gigaspora margarita]
HEDVRNVYRINFFMFGPGALITLLLNKRVIKDVALILRIAISTWKWYSFVNYGSFTWLNNANIDWYSNSNYLGLIWLL